MTAPWLPPRVRDLPGPRVRIVCAGMGEVGRLALVRYCPSAVRQNATDWRHAA